MSVSLWTELRRFHKVQAQSSYKPARLYKPPSSSRYANFLVAKISFSRSSLSLISSSDILLHSLYSFYSLQFFCTWSNLAKISSALSQIFLASKSNLYSTENLINLNLMFNCLSKLENFNNIGEKQSSYFVITLPQLLLIYSTSLLNSTVLLFCLQNSIILYTVSTKLSYNLSLNFYISKARIKESQISFRAALTSSSFFEVSSDFLSLNVIYKELNYKFSMSSSASKSLICLIFCPT